MICIRQLIYLSRHRPRHYDDRNRVIPFLAAEKVNNNRTDKEKTVIASNTIVPISARLFVVCDITIESGYSWLKTSTILGFFSKNSRLSAAHGNTYE